MNLQRTILKCMDTDLSRLHIIKHALQIAKILSFGKEMEAKGLVQDSAEVAMVNKLY